MPTKIEWADETWNPVTGCSHSGTPGCDNCYARRMAHRLRGRFGYPAGEPFRVTFHPDRLDEPRRWRKPRWVFVCSMGDLWHPDVDPLDRAAVIRATAAAPQHQYLFLTKRPERMAAEIEWRRSPNLWAGTSIENADAMVERLEPLLKTRAARRFVSCEPLLGLVDLKLRYWDELSRRKIRWVIAGGETGPGARPTDPVWARHLREDCAEARVPFFFKSWGDWLPIEDPQLDPLRGPRWKRVGKKYSGALLDGHEHLARPQPPRAPCQPAQKRSASA